MSTKWFGLILAGTVGVIGCQEQRDPINRVQPDYIDKVDLTPVHYASLTAPTASAQTTLTAAELSREPIFYTQTTLISKPTTTGYTGLTSYSENDKIRWEVTEGSLIARQAYSFIQGAPGNSAGIGQNPQTGDVVAVFAIKSHFDIRRAYNTTTGEELNVIEENAVDRPWYQRRYMHVDWSQNLIDGYHSVLEEANLEGKVKSEPVPVFVNTPDDPNAPVFEYQGKDADRKLTYFDIVNRATLHPETTSLSFSDGTSYANIPVCYLNQYEGSKDCAPSEVTFRLSFRREDPTRDYEPASLSVPLPDLNGSVANTHYLDMERFGFFDTMRVGYDPLHHNTNDSKRIHFAARHNLWLHHHQLAYADTYSTLCNTDSDCGDASQVCKIGNAPMDATHRGQCSTLAIAHIAGDISCKTDDDCRQHYDGVGGGISRTAVCDQNADGGPTCGEHYFRCSVDDECKKLDPASTCDMVIGYTRADNKGLCLMPFRQRQVRAIAYHESNGYPDYMQPVTEQIVTEWNQAFVDSVSAARRRECELEKHIDATTMDPKSNPCNSPSVTGQDPSLGADAQFVYVGCHSPVWGTAAGNGQHTEDEVTAAHNKGWDLAACGPQGTEARLGDLRYSMIGAITDHDQQGYWGLANIAADPETGEMVAGRGAVWQTITDYYATYLVELVKVLNGNTTADDITTGADIVSSVKQLGSGHMPSDQMLDAPFRAANATQTFANMKTGLDALKMPGAGWFTPGSGKTLWSKDINKPGAFDIAASRILNSGMLGDGTNRGTNRLLSLKGTPIESRLMNSAQARLASTATPDDTAILPQTLEEASPMRMQSRGMQHVLDRLRSKLAAYQCGMEAGFSDEMLLGFAQRLSSGAPIMQSNPDDKPVAFGRDWVFNTGGVIDYDLMTQYAAQFIHHGVLAHELGHSIGQRHNFTASADAINYFDNYWKVRAKGHPAGIRPRYEYLSDPKDGKYYSQEELDGRVDEFAYSSVMDYKGLNEDAHGLGRYDTAFVKNGYVNIVEAFKKVANNDGAVTYANNVMGNGISTMLDLRDWSKGGAIHGMHYSQIPALFGTKADGTPNIGTDNRYDVFLRETTSMAIPGWGPPSFTNVTNDNHVLVPYRFDSDDRAGLVWQCQRYDAGADPFESLHYVASHLVDYYFINSFARLRSGFSTSGYVARMWGRSIDQLRQTTQLLSFDLVNFGDFFNTNPSWNAFLTDPTQFGGYQNHAAMSLAADAFVGLLTMPEVGAHDAIQQADGSTVLSTSLNQGTMNIEINDGRYFESNWRNDVGFFWYEQLNRAGGYYDKVMALQAITDPELLLLQRDTPADIRLFQLSFYTMFPDQMLRLFGGMLSEDTADFSPVVSMSDSSIARTHVATLSDPTARGRVVDSSHIAIDPQDHFTIQLWGAVQTIAQFPATYDQKYMDYTRLWVDGSLEAVDVPVANTVSYTDPRSNITYRAMHIPCGTATAKGPGYTVGCPVHNGVQVDEAGIAARMILHLKDLHVVAATDATVALQEQQYVDLLNVMRDMTSRFGHGDSALP